MYYFSNTAKTLGYNDGRSISIGETHTVSGIPKLCSWGLHASPTVYKALKYALGPVLWRVEVTGNLHIGDDKLCGSSRKYLSCVDATEILKLFSRKCALSVGHFWDMPEAVKTFLETGAENKRSAAEYAAACAARFAAESAARSAAESAAESAAAYAARSAARSAMYAAAYAAASVTASAKSASEYATYAAAYAARSAARSAAEYAAEYAARSAARSAMYAAAYAARSAAESAAESRCVRC